MNVFRNCILIVPVAVVFFGGCALPVLSRPNATAPGGAQLALAHQYEQQGEIEMAQQVYRELIEAMPEQATPHHRLGILAAKQRDFESADRYFRQAHMLDPSNVDLLNDAGYAYFLQGRLPEAEEFLKLALERDPHNARAQNNLGLVLGRQGRREESLAMFRQVVPEAEAHANLAHASRQNADVSATSGRYRSTTPVQGGGFEPMLASRVPQRPARPSEAGATHSVAVINHEIERQRPVRIEAAAAAANLPKKRAAQQRMRVAQRGTDTQTAAQRQFSGAAAGAVREDRKLTNVAPGLPSRLFDPPRGQRADRAIQRNLQATGAPGREFRSAAQRVAERMPPKPSASEAALPAAVRSARRSVSKHVAASQMSTPRLFDPIRETTGRPSGVNDHPSAADRREAGHSRANDSRAPAVGAPRRSTHQGPEIVYLNRRSAKTRRENPRVKTLFGPETRGE